MFHDLYQLPVVILRVAMAYGPVQQDTSKLIPYVTRSLLSGEAPRLSSCRREVDWVYIDDVVEALLLAAEREGIDGMSIDIGSGEWVSIRTVVEYLVQMCNSRVEPLFGSLADRPKDQVRRANIAEAYARLGWRPRTPLATGLERTVEWHRQQLALGTARER
jgi:nucleoside-diphosphate-sugar epimerase